MGRNISKQYIFDVNGDPEYLKKPKMYSLIQLVRNKKSVYTINDNLQYVDNYPDKEYFNFKNDFIE